METANQKGRMTLPAEKGMEKELQLLMNKWGCDAVRDSDGTELPSDVQKLGMDVYSTLCLVRADQKWAKAHPDQLQQKYLISDPLTASTDSLEIDILKGYFKDQFMIDKSHHPQQWWEVIDRTVNQTVDPSLWEFNPDTEKVTIKQTHSFHVYTVSFLVYQIWDSTSMYNHITNNWTGEHTMSVDPLQPEARKHLLEYLDQWLIDHPNTDIVRFTSVAYHFTNIFNDKATCRYRDWSGFHDCVSPRTLEAFAKSKGYSLRPEDFVDAGYYNDINRVPTSQYLDWIDFVNESLVDFCGEWVDHVHHAGRKAMLFFCDHWIGTEPYGKRFPEMNFDSLVNPCKNGLEIRRIADIPGNYLREARLYPYFFPVNLAGHPSFAPDGDPKSECIAYWVNVRRALLQKLVDRIGFGGYLNLAVKFPDFIDYVAQLADEFREIHDRIGKTPSYKAPVKVGVLNAWGKMRSWITKEFHNGGLMESLTGLPFEVEFFNFSDIEKNGISNDIKVIINTGNAGTAWSGGEHWANEKVVTSIREWVNNGGGFIGVGEPTAHEFGGHFFQLFDILGVERERRLSIGKVKPVLPTFNSHFILEDQTSVNFGYIADQVYATGEDTRVLLQEKDSIKLAVNAFGKGRSVYMAGYQFSWENVRLLLRSIFWAAGMEGSLQKWFSTNLKTECAAFNEAGSFVVFNNSGEAQDTTVYNEEGKTKKISLDPYMSQWFEMKDF